MKLSSLLFLVTLATYGQAPSWSWVKGSGTGASAAESIATDAAGNVFIGGGFYDELDLGNNVTVTPEFETGTNGDVYVAKYNANGLAQWERHGLGASYDGVTAITVDGLGNLYAVGYFRSQSLVFSDVTLTSTYSGDKMFIIKYSNDGVYQWSKVLDSTGEYSIGSRIIADQDNNLYLVGYSNSNIVTIGSQQLAEIGDNDILLLKLSPDGNYLWGKRMGGTDDDYATSIDIDEQGNIYIGGYFNSNTIDLDGITLTKVSNTEGFIAKFTAAGTIAWATMQGGANQEQVEALVSDKNGSIYVTGTSNSPVVAIPSGSYVSHGGYDIFTERLNASTGMRTMVTGMGGTYNEKPTGIAFHAGEGVIVTGNFSSTTIHFGTTTITNPSSNNDDMLVCAFSKLGNPLWVKKMGTASDDKIRDVLVDSAGNTFVSGGYGNTINFDNIVLYGSGMVKNLFLAKLNPEALSEEEWNTVKITVTPNPVKDVLTITNDALVTKAEVYDIMGKVILEREPNEMNCTINMSGLVSGLYFVKVVTPNGKKTFKIVKQD